MRRKLVRQGQNALTVTLPKKWTRLHDLNAGEEVEIKLDGLSLVINDIDVNKLKTKEINLKKTTKLHLRSIIASAYKSAYNEIIINSKEEIKLSEIDKVVNSFTGLELTTLSKNKVVIKSFLVSNTHEIDNLIIKMIHITKLMFGSLEEDWDKVDFDNLDYLLWDKQVKLRDHLLRMIHESKYGGDKSYDYYDFVNMIHYISEGVYYMAEYVKESKIERSKLIVEIDQQLEELGKIYMKKDFDSSNEYWQDLRAAYRENLLPKPLRKIANKEDPVFLAHYFFVIRLFSQLSSRLLNLTSS